MTPRVSQHRRALQWIIIPCELPGQVKLLGSTGDPYLRWYPHLLPLIGLEPLPGIYRCPPPLLLGNKLSSIVSCVCRFLFHRHSIEGSLHWLINPVLMDSQQQRLLGSNSGVDSTYPLNTKEQQQNTCTGEEGDQDGSQ